MKKARKFIGMLVVATIVITVVFSHSVFATIVNTINCTIPSEVNEEDNPTLTQMYRIYIENFSGGIITKVDNSGVHTKLGNVLRVGTTVKDASAGFWAAHYDKASDGTHSCVTAAGVNAMHIRCGPNASYDPLYPDAWMPKMFSLGIKEDYDYSGGVYSDSMIYTDIPGGSAIFGGWTAPFVGSPVQFLDTDNTWKSLDLYFNGDYTKPIPKRLLIVVNKPSTSNDSLDCIEFENWAAGDTVGGVTKSSNGRVLVHYPNSVTKHVADVIQRVCGTGRFVGSEYAEVGRVRANHPGVLCLSTSPKVGYTTDPEQRGGFQFVPANHAKYLCYNLGQDSFIGKPQWAIIAHVGADKSLLYDTRYVIDGKLSYDPIWESVAPVFGQYIKPKHIPTDLSNTTYFVVSTDFGATWQNCPTIQGVTDPSTGSPVNDWTNIRLYLKY